MYRRPRKGSELSVFRRSMQKDGEKMTLIKKGTNIIRPAVPKEIIPGLEAYYIKRGYSGKEFVLSSFSVKAEWNSIIEMCRCDMVYVDIDFKYSGRRSK